MSANDEIVLRARWIVPIAEPPIRDGFVSIVNQRVTSVSQRCNSPYTDLGDVALLPGLVNPHTHLEFSNLAKPLGEPGMAFPDWLLSVVSQRAGDASIEETRQAKQHAIQSGWNESRKFGVVAIGEIATDPWNAPERIDSDQQSLTVFLERIGLNIERATDWPAQINAYERQLDPLPATQFALSPHAPYSVHPQLFDRLIETAARQSLPTALHLAESPPELELLHSGTGPLKDFLERLHVFNPSAFDSTRTPSWFLERLAKLDRSLVIHGNYLTDQELQFIGQRRDQMTLVYCPRTHAYFNHSPYPLEKAIQSGVRIALGTDSRASSPDLNLFAELKLASRLFPQIAPHELLRMVTSNAAFAMKIDHDFGSIQAGAIASFSHVPVDSNSIDAYEAVLSASESTLTITEFGDSVQGLTRDGR